MFVPTLQKRSRFEPGPLSSPLFVAKPMMRVRNQKTIINNKIRAIEQIAIPYRSCQVKNSSPII